MIRRDLSTKKNREFWDFVDQTVERIKNWPAWKRGGIVKSSEPSKCDVTGELVSGRKWCYTHDRHFESCEEMAELKASIDEIKNGKDQAWVDHLESENKDMALKIKKLRKEITYQNRANKTAWNIIGFWNARAMNCLKEKDQVYACNEMLVQALGKHSLALSEASSFVDNGSEEVWEDIRAAEKSYAEVQFLVAKPQGFIDKIKREVKAWEWDFFVDLLQGAKNNGKSIEEVLVAAKSAKEKAGKINFEEGSS